MSKILYAASTISHINNFHTDYIEALRAEGHEVYVMAKGEGADFNIDFEKKMLSRKNNQCRKEIKRIFRYMNFDAVVLNTSLAAFHIRLAMPKKNRPRVLNIVHGYLFGSNTGFIKRTILLLCERMLKNKTDSIIVMNREDFEIAKRYKLAVHKLRMSLGMGAMVKGESFSKKAIIQEMNAEGKWVMLFVGELSGRKNQAMLISALALIKKRIPNAVLWLVGEGDKKGEFEALARELGVSDSVVFAGRRPNPCDFIRACDLYVTASRIEGLPFNVMEAMGCSKTVLASDVKGHRDLIDDGVTGYLYPEDDIECFIDKAYAIYSGRICVDENDVYKVYKKYEKTNVFEKTYLMIKEECGLDGVVR